MVKNSQILVAEDEDTDVMLLRIALARSGLPNELIVTRNGQEAVRYLEQQRAQALPGLFILDLKMPEMDGFAVLEWLLDRAEFAPMPVVVLTSSTHESDMRKALQMGARGFYIKPSSLAGLMELLQRLHDRWLALSIIPPEPPSQRIAPKVLLPGQGGWKTEKDTLCQKSLLPCWQWTKP